MVFEDYMSVLKDKVDKNPKKAVCCGLLSAGVFGSIYSLINGDSESLSDSFGNVAASASRITSLYSPEIISESTFAIDFFGSVLNTEYREIVSGTGILSGGLLAAGSIRSDIFEKYKSLDDTEKQKLKKGLLYMLPGVLMLGLGCTERPEPSIDIDDVKSIDRTDEVPYAEDNHDNVSSSDKIPKDVERTEEQIIRDDYPWAINNPDSEYGKIDDNLLGIEIEGIINVEAMDRGIYSVADENRSTLIKHMEYPNGDVIEEYNLDGEGDPDLVLINTEETGLIGFEYQGHNHIDTYLAYLSHPEMYDNIDVRLRESDINNYINKNQD